MDASARPIWKSKTGFVGLVLASVLEFHPAANAWIVRHPDTLVLIYTVVILGLRRISSGAVFIFKRKAQEKYDNLFNSAR